MTIRLYLAAVQFLDGSTEDGDIPIERVFVNASDVPEIWVETEMSAVPGRGKAATFTFGRSMGLGFTRIRGTVERTLTK